MTLRALVLAVAIPVLAVLVMQHYPSAVHDATGAVPRQTPRLR